MNIVYFVIGNSSVILMQVGFSIRTLLAQATEEDTIYVVTDIPKMFDGLPRVKTVCVSQEDIREWRGRHDFFWRVKIMVLRKIAQMSPGKPIVYLDGDTVLFGRLEELRELLAAGCGLMHRDEGCPSDMKEKSLRMWQTVGGRTYGGITIGQEHHMWNAGVVAIPAIVAGEMLDLALTICDGMLDDKAEPVVIEQYSLSVAMKERTERMLEARSWIGHYWHNKLYWSAYIADFFVRSYRLGNTVEDDIMRIRKTNLRGVHRRILVKRTIAKLLGKLH